MDNLSDQDGGDNSHHHLCDLEVFNITDKSFGTMKKEITVKGISLKCDACGEFIELSDLEGAAFIVGDNDGSEIEKEATEDEGWLVVDGRHYCPNCWERQSDGTIKTKDGRLYDGVTLQDITPWTPNLVHVKVEISRPLDFSSEHYEAIDLGLPSGRKWADRNLGQSLIDDPVDYGFLMDFDSAQEFSLPEGWHIPTKEDFQELYDNCDHEWIDDNGLRGMKFISKNGNSIFFPAAGRYDGTTLYNRGAYGYYWSSSYYSATRAYYLLFNSEGVGPQGYSHRRHGFSVRAVQ